MSSTQTYKLLIEKVNKELLSNPKNTRGFVLLPRVITNAEYDIRYHSTYNFIGDRIDGYKLPRAILTREATLALDKVSNHAFSLGLRLKIFDAYRPQSSVDHFVRWAKNPNDTKMKAIFYPDIDKSQLFPLGYISERSSHTRGSTVDLTLVKSDTGDELPMGSEFDFFGERSHTFFEGITDEEHENRLLLRKLMTDGGFSPLDTEWWHFTLRNEPFPDTYFEFEINTKTLERIEQYSC